MRHLTEDEIQAYLDGRAIDLGPDLRDHPGTCRLCHEAIQTYKAVYVGLADDKGFEAPPNLAANVIARLDLKAHRRGLSLPTDIVVVAAAIVCMVVVAFSFLDLSSFVGYGSQSLESARSFLIGLNHALTLALSGAAILLVMGALDLVIRPKKLTR